MRSKHFGHGGQVGRIVRTVAVGVALLTAFLPGVASAAGSTKAAGSAKAAALAGPEVFLAHLTSTQETPPTGSGATGFGSVTLGGDQTTITVNESWTGLTSPATISHIHGPEGPGVAAPVLFPFSGVPAAVAGSIPTQTFTVTPDQVAQLRAGLMYFNVHSSTDPAGEIRGQILLASGSQGIRTVTAGGQVSASGLASTFGPTLGHLNAPLVGISDTPDDQGYWLAAADGGVFSFGNAPFFGSLGNVRLKSPIVGIAHPRDGLGYWMVGADGGVFSFGDAPFFGSLGNVHLNSPIVGTVATPDGQGYWLVGADGGVFNFGDAGFFGSLGAVHLNARIVGIAPTLDGKGYWLVGADGGVFTFGDALFSGSAGAVHLNAPVVGIARTPTGGGYWLAGGDGRVLSFGDASGLASATPAATAVVGIAATGNG